MVDKIGLIGLAVMGQNLVLNMEEKGFEVVIYNRTSSRTDDFMENRAEGKNIEAAYSPDELIEKLEKPRVIMLMIKSGAPVDKVIEQITPLLDEGDTLVDGGNSFFKDTERRSKELAEKGINYLGIGISGGEEGARHGPSIMPGGQEESYNHVKDIYEAVAAKVDGEPCVTYLGPRGAGHFVKMVHNGIEYAIMQAIAEAYHIMFEGLNIDYDEMHEVFSGWSESERLGGFLTEITATILITKDPRTQKPLLEVIKDTAKSKGTGKWTSQQAYDLGVPVHSISSAVLSRIISSYKDERQDAEKTLTYNHDKVILDKEEILRLLEQALYSAVIIAYAQGFHLLKEASKEYEYNLDMERIATIWRGGCIIRSRLLEPIRQAFSQNPDMNNLMLAFPGDLNESTKGLRRIMQDAANLGIPVPVFSQTLAYFDSYRKGMLPTASMIQAMRDYFGAHTYERNDDDGKFHIEWTADRDETRIE